MSDVVMLSLDNGLRYDWQNIYKRLKSKQPRIEVRLTGVDGSCRLNWTVR